MAQKIDPLHDELEARAREVLREIVQQYIANGEPISSRWLAKCGKFDLSPASLRNVMADLEDLGYVCQPHTSAGRVPTDRGYRFFIDHLMRSKRLTEHERHAIDDQVSQVSELDEVMQLATRVLSKLSDQVGIIFTPKLHHLVMRSIDFVLVSEHKIMCVMVSANGVVVNKMIETGQAFDRDELERIGRFLTSEYSGLSLEGIRSKLSDVNEEAARENDQIRSSVSLGLEAVNENLPVGHDLYVEGETSILNKPEYSGTESMRKTFSAFQERDKLVEILNRCLSEDGLQVLIGSESRFTQSYNFSLVATRYGTASAPFGLVGVIGPTRMEYDRMATLVDYLGRALSRKIEESTSGVES
jgi:heat-inducible transcriptional repressor